MTRPRYDLAIIGGGSAGLTAAQIAQSLGARTLLIDKERLGGDCLSYGCVPSKSLIHIANTVQQIQEAKQLGLHASAMTFDMAQASKTIQHVIQRIGETEKKYTEGVTVKFGQVAFKSSTVLCLNDEEITCRNILIATGSHPIIPPLVGLQEGDYLTNEDVFDLTRLPSSIIIIGAGPVGIELGQALARLGITITILQGPERILPREEPEVSEAIVSILRQEGITDHTGARVIEVKHDSNKKVVIARQGEQLLTSEAEILLLAVGRQPNLEHINLEAAGVRYNQRGIHVNAYLQTSAANIFALGDVIGGYQFTHVATYQAGIATRNALLPMGKKKVDYHVVPWCTFSDPEVARVGLTLAQAQEKHTQVRAVTFPWHDIDRAQTEQKTAGFIKLVLAGKKDEIVGAHLIGSHAGELLGEVTLALRHHFTINDIFNTIHAYPTLNTGLQQAAFAAYLTSTQVTSNRKIIQTLLRLRR